MARSWHLTSNRRTGTSPRPARRRAFCLAGLLMLPLLCAAATAPHYPVQQLAPGVFAHTGAIAELSRETQGDIANTGFIIGSHCVAVIDTGNTVIAGQRLRAAIRQQTRLPVCYVINTHAHPDHLLGNAAFLDEHPKFVGNARLPAALAARQQDDLRALARVDPAWAAAARPIPPDIRVSGTMTLDLGHRKLLLRAWPTAHTDSDLTVLDVRTGTLFAGDLLFVRYIPVLDGSLTGWLHVLPLLQQLHVHRMVPGHGPLDTPWPRALAAERRYLTLLDGQTRQAIRDGKRIEEAVHTVGRTEQRRWLLFDNYHARNVTTAYGELEWEVQ